MHGGVILYAGKYGSTEQYARWLSQGTAYRCFDLEQNPNPDLKPYRVVIVGSPIRQRQLLLGGWCREHRAEFLDKQVIVFSVSATPVSDPVLPEMIEESLGEALFKQCQWFPLPGRLITAELSLKDRLILYFHDYFGEKISKRYMQRDFNHIAPGHLEPIFAYLWDWYHRDHRPLYQSGKLRMPKTGHLND